MSRSHYIRTACSSSQSATVLSRKIKTSFEIANHSIEPGSCLELTDEILGESTEPNITDQAMAHGA